MVDDCQSYTALVWQKQWSTLSQALRGDHKSAYQHRTVSQR